MKKNRVLVIIMVAALYAAGSLQLAKAQGRGHDKHQEPKRGQEVKREYHPVVVRKAHVRYEHMPRWGTVVATRPPASVEIRSHRNPYYSSNGAYYAPRNSGYAVVRPARGLRISILPAGYRNIALGRHHYFYYYGTFYEGYGDEYRVVGPPLGAIVDALPDGYDITMINGIEYYFFDGTYYAEVDAPEFPDGVGFEVVNP